MATSPAGADQPVIAARELEQLRVPAALDDSTVQGAKNLGSPRIRVLTPDTLQVGWTKTLNQNER
jgi:hypothetical protein